MSDFHSKAQRALKRRFKQALAAIDQGLLDADAKVATSTAFQLLDRIGLEKKSSVQVSGTIIPQDIIIATLAGLSAMSGKPVDPALLAKRVQANTPASDPSEYQPKQLPQLPHLRAESPSTELPKPSPAITPTKPRQRKRTSIPKEIIDAVNETEQEARAGAKTRR